MWRRKTRGRSTMATFSSPPRSQAQPPPQVLAAAAEQGLGTCRMVENNLTRIRSLRSGLLMMTVLVGVIVLTYQLLIHSHTPGGRGNRGLGILMLTCCFLLIWTIFATLRDLWAGNVRIFLLDNGLIFTRNKKKVDVIAWSDIDELLLWKAGGKGSLRGQLLGYCLVTFDGRKVPIAIQP